MAQFQPVVSNRYPYLDINVTIRNWQARSYALIDTGFTGSLVVPAALLTEQIGLPDSRIEWELADGSLVDAPVYIGSVEIPDLPPLRRVGITFLGDEYILGRGIIDRYRITLDHGERVILEA